MAGWVLKKAAVRTAEGRRRIGAAAGGGGQAAPEASACLVQQTPTGAIIEVICPCGRKTHVQCDYAAEAGPG